MKTLLFIIIHLVSYTHQAYAQSNFNLREKIISINAKSNDIYNSSAGKEIMSFGSDALIPLTSFFDDTTSTSVYSDCQSRYLSLGDIAIILADQIERMPYSQLTGIQNCLFIFCPNNSNLIEYYLNPIKSNGYNDFKTKYIIWLNSKERRKFVRQHKRQNNT